jgi:hypothetical protein
VDDESKDERADERTDDEPADEGDLTDGDDPAEAPDAAIKRQIQEAVERFEPEPGMTAPLDQLREDEKDLEPAAAMPAADPDDDSDDEPDGDEDETED